LGKGGLMQLDRKPLAFLQLPATKGDLYAPPSGSKGLVHTLIFHNTNTTAELVVLNYHNGTSEHEILNQSVAAGDTLTWNFKGAGDIVEDGGKYTGNTTTASKVTLKISGTEETPSAAGSVGGAESNLWAHPSSAHAQDDEFESTTLTGWSVQNLDGPAVGSISYGTVDAYDTTFTSGNAMRINAHTSGRRSWAIIQTPGSSDEFALFKAYTLPTNLLMYARMQWAQKVSGFGGAAGDSNFAISFMKATAGVPTVASRIMLHINVTSSGVFRAEYSYYNNSGTRVFKESTDDVDYRGQAIEYVAIHKVGTTYHGWVYTGGNWIWLTTLTEATVGFTPDLVGFCQHQVSSSNIVNPVGTDFIRFVETDKFLF
jgi:hypothetical protein